MIAIRESQVIVESLHVSSGFLTWRKRCVLFRLRLRLADSLKELLVYSFLPQELRLVLR